VRVLWLCVSVGLVMVEVSRVDSWGSDKRGLEDIVVVVADAFFVFFCLTSGRLFVGRYWGGRLRGVEKAT